MRSVKEITVFIDTAEKINATKRNYNEAISGLVQSLLHRNHSRKNLETF